MEQRVEKLSVADEGHLARQRDWLLGHYADGDSSVYRESYAGPLVPVQTILDEGWVDPHETWKLQCLGIALGDALQKHLGLEWSRLRMSMAVIRRSEITRACSYSR
jgi:hypothetical protein